MKKIVKYFVILIVFSFFAFWFYTIYMTKLTGCSVKSGDAVFQDRLVCDKQEIVPTGYLSSMLQEPNLIARAVSTYKEGDKLCYTDEQKFYIYNIKKKTTQVLSLEEFIKVNHSQFKLSSDFYTLPDDYLKEFANNCKK
ncbi:hypothetical protein [Pasteurella bettyae]|uniref:Uncharacterized protein n=1 Tax=Pasteurella bettyae CCUG 2042 TaxID=1095749 RepID=I3DIL9_9PAST|nr:hypothetical protein [Pasteurella bettyae]EIJ71562.1 hypothetical protein HMPREF1052_0136 [Pasteurella bettyae CCUG 2042]SUB21662.1 Uncharacterised protein [Pasteurella bettyae]